MAVRFTKQSVKPVLGTLVLLATIAIFAYYSGHHPQVWQALRHLKGTTLLLLLALYGAFIATLATIQSCTLALCDTQLSQKENFLLTIYSSIINFFGPLQSGPGFRAVYLKRRHGTKLKNYTLATMVYYGFFALFSGLFLVSGLVGWWGVVGLLGLAIICMYGALKLPLPFIRSLHTLQLQRVGWLALATLAQVLVVTIIYFTELHSLNAHISFGQALIYTGAADFALFVSLTPGAIGFRESFLLFSRDLHHIPARIIATASLIDRAVYIVLLGLLFVIVVRVHAKSFLTATSPAESPSADA